MDYFFIRVSFLYRFCSFVLSPHTRWFFLAKNPIALKLKQIIWETLTMLESHFDTFEVYYCHSHSRDSELNYLPPQTVLFVPLVFLIVPQSSSNTICPQPDIPYSHPSCSLYPSYPPPSFKRVLNILRFYSVWRSNYFYVNVNTSSYPKWIKRWQCIRMDTNNLITFSKHSRLHLDEISWRYSQVCYDTYPDSYEVWMHLQTFYQNCKFHVMNHNCKLCLTYC